MKAILTSAAKHAAIEMGVFALGKLAGVSTTDTVKGVATIAAAKIVGNTLIDAMSAEKPVVTPLVVPVEPRKIPSKVHAGIQTPGKILTTEEYKTINRKASFATLTRFALFFGAVFFIAFPAMALVGSTAGLGLASGWYIVLGIYLLISSFLNDKLRSHFMIDNLTSAPKDHIYFNPGDSVNRSNEHNVLLFALASLFTPFVWFKLTCFDSEKEQRFQHRLANN